MFAIFSPLCDSIQASRLILRAPTVSPSIRNMYNSTACFFLPPPPLPSFSLYFFLNIHSYYYQASVSEPAEEERGLSARGDGGFSGVGEWGVGGAAGEMEGIGVRRGWWGGSAAGRLVRFVVVVFCFCPCPGCCEHHSHVAPPTTTTIPPQRGDTNRLSAATAS